MAHPAEAPAEQSHRYPRHLPPRHSAHPRPYTPNGPEPHYTFPGPPLPVASSSSSSWSSSAAAGIASTAGSGSGSLPRQSVSTLKPTRPRFTTVLRAASYGKGKQPEQPYPAHAQSGGIHPPVLGSTIYPAMAASSSSSSSSMHASQNSHHHHHLALPSLPSRPSLARRGSHPLSHRSKNRQEQDDGEFIKKAFENLAIEPYVHTQRLSSPSGISRAAPAAPASSGRYSGSHGLHQGEVKRGGLDGHEVCLVDMLDNDDPLGVGVTIHRREVGRGANNASRTSLASSLSPPASAVSLSELASLSSARPLLSHTHSPNAGAGAGNGGGSTPVQPHPYAAQHAYLHQLHQQQAQTQTQTQGRRSESSYSYAWSASASATDPFEDAEASRRMRRRSTISGYSVSSADWMSLRRGSLASVVEPSHPHSHPYPHTHAPPHAYQGQYQPPYQGQGASKPGSIAAGSVKSDPFAERKGSLRWEAWATAYRESIPTHLSLPPSAQPSPNEYPSGSRPVRVPRLSLTGDSILSSAASAHEQHPNLFYPLRRQFIARHGSRSESNHILVIELCHALEEYSLALAELWKLAQAQAAAEARPSSHFSQQQQDGLEGAREAAVGAGAGAGQEQAASLMPHVEMLASELDSLVREIIEAVPAFSYALGQGSYGPLPFSVHHLTTPSPGAGPRSYLEQVQAIPKLSDPCADDPHADPDADVDEGMFASPPETWWPARLKADLYEGILVDTTEDSPIINMHTFTISPPAAEYDSPPRGADFGGVPVAESGQPYPPAAPACDRRKDLLLEEGRRRWLEYKEARQRSVRQ